jgi:hypothetical protein
MAIGMDEHKEAIVIAVLNGSGMTLAQAQFHARVAAKTGATGPGG